jgi:hypothetical protein
MSDADIRVQRATSVSPRVPTQGLDNGNTQTHAMNHINLIRHVDE